jgi:ABC-type nickel/cobalt efflux system permease component RcnA
VITVLALGFLIGLQHAIEVDHVAAVAALVTRGKSIAETAKQGAVWGLGHTLTLLLFGGAVLLAGEVVPSSLSSGLEMAVGVMLVLLGADVLRRMIRDRIHFHLHAHGRERHFHAHSHREGGEHAADPHRHEHPSGFPLRSLFVGMMHGMAGSAALIILALGTVESAWQGFVYIFLFGLGSIVGMALLGAVISIPLRYSATGLTWAHNGLKSLIGLFTISLGAYIVYDVGIASGLLV